MQISGLNAGSDSAVHPKVRLLQEDSWIAVASSRPTAPGQVNISSDANMPHSGLQSREFIELFLFVRRVALALKDATGVQRVALATDGDLINLIPLHGLSELWNVIAHNEEVYDEVYPGYLTSKNGPRLLAETLTAIRDKINAVSGVSVPYNTTFKGDAGDSNLFARIVRGELEQWRIWEDDEHVAFLTPFANTPGFTVLVPRRHLPSDIFSLDDAAYAALVHAAHAVMGVLKEALHVEKVGVFFEGFEIDYTHVKLIPVHARQTKGGPGVIASRAPFYDKYPGYITTQPGPDTDIGSIEAFAATIRKTLTAGRSGS